MFSQKIKIFKKEENKEDQSKSALLFFDKLASKNAIVKLNSNLNYTKIHFNNGQVKQFGYTLMRFEELLKENANYLRINRQTIVNVNYIKEINTLESILIIEPNEEHIISRRRIKNIYFKLENIKSEFVKFLL